MNHSFFLITFLLFLVLFSLALKKILRGRKIEQRISKKLNEHGKINGLFGMVYYTKERLPWGSFSKDYNNFYDEDDSEEIKELKTLWIVNVKEFRKIMFLVLLDVFIIMIYSYLIA
ncbi:hypothetical protein CRV02_12735 [Arcobacter sp. CECT 8989]|uniref:hypothetical protein n=1 Tax=Arcobacter sp. CECT 8989 TaxID=2044509 RepID=UPI00100A2A0A|nr:hypothetical protein [Arcobacter sp. CECT 8989]RXJ98911.1 hypothetical protein CRV02_12735 [Arcobacter sp. CECT 8989]